MSTATETPETPVEKPATPAKKASFAHKLYTGEVSYDFVGNRKRWYIVSAALLAISALAMIVLGLNLGIEFKGGADFTAPVSVTADTTDQVRSAVQALNLPDNDDVSVTTVGEDQVRVQTRSLSVDEVTQVKQAIATAVGGIEVDQVGYSLIGASWGSMITQQAIIALVVFLVLVSLLIWAYFRNYKMAIAAIVALLHDLVITVGVYALVGFTVTPATLIGVLTILGYSLYDTVVVFDKVRENVADLKNSRQTYTDAANAAVNQVLIRSINTTIIGVLPVAALTFTGAFIVGTGPLKDLGLALLVGMIAGAYSSIFIAAPLLAQLKEAEPEMREHRERLERRAKRHSEKDVATERSKRVLVTDGSGPLAEVDEGVEPERLGLVSANELARQHRVQPQRNTRAKRRK
ncbi:protein translocase subunit SecF [Micropruina sonneratiae]|uniref:protein translocase subunit SecF n=1 Tax=Micropruina sonneratiae TaxID=2986940 RepID=UPI0022279D26|nr:protein translocase subunit SecF [Micropruina sp. KQZ13P-5]MCW3157757.1 protein translocase subunit SecF [Micropruina sp. KQZ13P-5]